MVFGYPDRCLNGLDETLALARLVVTCSNSCFGHCFIGELSSEPRRGRRVEAVGNELIDLGTEHKLQLWTAEGSFFQGSVQAQRGSDKRKGIELMRETEKLLPYGNRTAAPAGHCGPGGNAWD